MSNNINARTNIFVYGSIAAIVILSILARFYTSIPNFAPFGALALFAGAYISNRSLAIFLPLAGLFIGDVAMEIAESGTGFYPEMPLVYLAYILTVALGFSLRNNKSVTRIAGTSILGTLLFFVVTNFGVWALTNIYPHTFAGFVSCYVMAIPFIKSTLISDLLFNTALFGGAYLIFSRSATKVSANA